MGDEVKNTPWSPNMVQTGNPHNLTINQHLYPKAILKRFSGQDGQVIVNFQDERTAKREGPKSTRFVHVRSWDQKTETVSTSMFEEPFQKMATRLFKNGATALTIDEMRICTQMHALWQFRCWIAKNPQPDLVLSSTKVPPQHSSEWDQSEGEQLEKKGYVIPYYGSEPDKDGFVSTIIPARMNVLQKLMNHIWKAKNVFSYRQWDVLLDPDEKFIIPDYCPRQPLLPIAPNMCLIGDVVVHENNKKLNELIQKFLQQGSENYWISKG